MVSIKNYSVGSKESSWKDGEAQTITFIVTDDCNLRCKYCYITHKAPDKKMSFEVARDFVDYVLTSDITFSNAVILDFIGGEPTLEMGLIDKICDYFKLKAYSLGHEWYWNYRINICTNGVNYLSDEVQQFVVKNLGKLSLSITIDGTREKHDLQRVFPDGSGSYDIIEKGIDTWIRDFSGSTKVTFASDDLPLLRDSIVSLWDKGIYDISSNVVFEDVWKDGDDDILFNQLISLADYVIDNDLYNSRAKCSFFSDSIGYPYEDHDLEKTHCGAGKMMALSFDGKIYPCLRYYGHSLNNHEEWPLGSLKTGFDMEKVRPFMLATNRVQSDQECLNCEIASGCAFCQGFNYDDADTPTNFHRAKYICKMHKARVRANEYYFARMLNKYGVRRSDDWKRKKELYFLLSDDYTTYCSYENISQGSGQKMGKEHILEGLKFSANGFFRPVFVHSKSSFSFEQMGEYDGYDVLHIVPAKFCQQAVGLGLKSIMPVYDNDSWEDFSDTSENCILNVSAKDIDKLSMMVGKVLSHKSRINLNITSLDSGFDEAIYQQELEKINALLTDIFFKEHILKEVSLLTDICFMEKHDNCGAGDRKFVLSPLGDIYTCCGVYSTAKSDSIGNAHVGIIKKYDARLYKTENNNLCMICDAYQCKNCVYVNRQSTKEVNVSPSFQCRKSHIERLVSSQLLSQIEKAMEHDAVQKKKIPELDYLDPMQAFLEKTDNSIGYYKANYK